MVGVFGSENYTDMGSIELRNTCQDDASKWAAAFCQHAEKLGHKGIDESWMADWFSQAIDHSFNVKLQRRSAELNPLPPEYLAELQKAS